jgi:hypothetical protein
MECPWASIKLPGFNTCSLKATLPEIMTIFDSLEEKSIDDSNLIKEPGSLPARFFQRPIC